MNLRRLAREMVSTTPEYWMTRLRTLYRKRFPEAPEQLAARIRNEAPRAARAPLIQQTVQRIAEGASVDSVLTGPRARAAGPGIVVYAFLAEWLTRQKPGQSLLDIGCLLRNRFTANLVREQGVRVLHCGPAYCRDAMDGTGLHYDLFDFANSFANADVFPRIVCLGFLEHVGCVKPREGNCPLRPQSAPSFGPIGGVLKVISGLTAPGGEVLLSMPHGAREVRVDPRDDDLVERVFDDDAVSASLRLLSECGIAAAATSFQLGESGWVRVETADGGASAMVLIEGRKDVG